MAGKSLTCSNDRDTQIKDIFGRRAGLPHDFTILFYVDVGIYLIKQARSVAIEEYATSNSTREGQRIDI